MTDSKGSKVPREMHQEIMTEIGGRPSLKKVFDNAFLQKIFNEGPPYNEIYIAIARKKPNADLIEKGLDLALKKAPRSLSE